MKKALFSFLFLLFIQQYIAQKNEFLKIPEITVEDVQSTKSTFKGEVPAEVLYNSHHYRLDRNGTLYVDVFNRIKIYNKDKAGDYLTKEIYVYDGNRGKEKLADVKAFTYNMEADKMKSTKVEKDNKYKSTENKSSTVTKFAFPEVKDGSVVEYSYTIESPYYYSMPKVMVQRELPVKYLEYVLDAPLQFSYTINYTGTLVPTYIDVKEKTMYGGDYKSYNYGFKNIPAYKDENFVGNNDNFKSSIKPEINSVAINSQIKRYSMTWEDVRKTLYAHENFGGELKNKSIIKNILPAEIKSIVNESERADAIFKFVQNEYKWNREVGLIADDGVRKLLNTKTGNSAEINFLLVMLLNDANLKADPVVLSTVSRGALMTYIPSLTQLNYVIAQVNLTNGGVLYDATSKYTSKNMLPLRAQNNVGYLMTNKDFKEVNINYQDKSNTTLTVNAKLNKDGTFSGNFSDSDTKLFAMMANEMFNENSLEYQKLYKEKFKFPINDLKSQGKESGNFETTFNFDSDTFVDAVGNKLVFNPLLFLFAKNHDFDQVEERKSPLEFYSAYTRVKKVTIDLPEGFVFENIPTSKKFRTDDDEISYLYFVKQDGNKLVVETTTTVKSPIYPKEYYTAFKQIFDNITKMEGQVVTAVRKN